MIGMHKSVDKIHKDIVKEALERSIIMKKRYLWGGILNKKRFENLEKEKLQYLQNLTLNESAKEMEYLLSSNLFADFKDRFIHNEPLCFNLTLKMRKKNVRK